MSEHLSPQDLESYRQSALPPLELLAVDDHLAACEQCRAQLAEAVPATTAWQTLSARLDTSAERIEHLSYEQLAAYVDEQLGGAERRAAESHLEICEMCAAELQDLRAFSVKVAALPQATQSPVTATLTSAPRESFWQRLAESVTVRWPLLAGASALLVLAAWLLFSQLRVREQTPPPIITTTSPTLAPPTPAGIEVNPAVPASVLALNDGGGRVTLDEQGRLATPHALPPGYEQLIKKSLTTGRAETPQLAALTKRSEILMGGASEGVPFALLSPVAAVINTDRPTFRWQPLAGAASYIVKVYDANYQRVAVSPALTTTEWSLPQALKRGGAYSWQVSASKDGQEVSSPVPPAPEAKFKVLEQTQAEELARARQQFAGSHLTLGLLYARAGLLDDAERELQALLEANRDSAVARNLLRNLKAARRVK